MKDLRKKKLLIYPSFQLRLVIFNALVMAGAFSIMAFEIRLALSDLRAMGVSVSLQPGHPYFKFVDFHSQRLYWAVGISFILSSVVSSLITLRLSHRLAGPIARLRSFFISLSENGLKSGEPESLKFRKNDFFGDLPPVINSAIQNLNKTEKAGDDRKKSA